MATMKSGRFRRIDAIAAIAVAAFAAGVAGAETDVGPVHLTGEVELGGRVVFDDEDAAKFREYRDLQDGLLSRYDLLIDDEDIAYWLRVRGENAGYDDQRYWLEGGRYGRWEVGLFYGELPHVFSRKSQTPYRGQNHLDLPLSVPERNALEAAGVIAPGDLPFAQKDLELRWREGRIESRYHLGEEVLLRGGYRIQDKQGRRAFGIPFGSPGGEFINLRAPVNERIHEVRMGADWVRENVAFSAEYLGNFFDNDYRSISGDNPLVSPATLTDGPDQGRSAAFPDNWAQSMLLSGTATIPWDVPNRISASFAYGYRRQNEEFLPHTINPRLPDPPLPRDSLHGKVQTLLGNVVATVQPTPTFGAKLRYRIYDYDNKTDSIEFPAWIRTDADFETNTRTSVHNDYRRQEADLDLSWDFAENWTGVLGYGWDYWNRSGDREVDHLHEHGPGLKLDYRALGDLFLHAGYEFRTRDGSNYDPFAPIDASFDITDPGELSAVKFSDVRKFDEADRYVHRANLLGRLTPTDDLELTFTGRFSHVDYHNSDFGLTKAIEWSIGSDAFYQFHPRVGVLGYYTYEWRKSWQDSRYRPRTFAPPIVVTDDPANNWDSRTRYGYHNAGVVLRLAVVPEKLDADLGYLVEYGKERTKAEGAAGGAANGDAVDYPKIDDLLQAVSATLSWHFTDRVTFRAGYRFEDYDIDDFKSDFIPASGTDGENVFVSDVIDDYTAHVFILSAGLRF